MKKIVSFSFIGIILLSTFIYAAGSSGSSGSSTRPAANDEPKVEQVAVRKACDDYTYLRERVRCRLTEGEQEEVKERIHESCTAASDRAACQRLYDDVTPCYHKRGEEKDRCFRNVALQSRRSYMVILLYDLEERVEERHENGELTDDEAADLVTKIVEVKRLILSGEPPGRVREELQELKLLWSRDVK